MNANPRWIGLLLGVLLVTGSGCASTSAPDGWLSPAVDMPREAYGGWAAVRFGDPAAPTVVQGELIAATSDSLFVLPLQDSLRVVARSTVNELNVTEYDSNWGYLSLWTVLGTLSTASHGAFLILSAPIWLIGGSAATSSQSRRPIHTNPPLEMLRQFARFPQGLPPGVTRDALRPKPLDERRG